MILRWLEHAAAFLILWFVLAVVIGVIFGAAIHRGNPTGDAETEAWEQDHQP